MEPVWDSVWDKRNTIHWPLKSKLFHFILLYKCFNFKSAQFWCNAPCTIHQLWYTLCMVDFKSAQFWYNAPCTNFVQLVQSTNFGVHLAYHFKSAQFIVFIVHICWYNIQVRYQFIVHILLC